MQKWRWLVRENGTGDQGGPSIAATIRIHPTSASDKLDAGHEYTATFECAFQAKWILLALRRL